MSKQKSFPTPGINDVKPGGGAHKNQKGNQYYLDLVKAKKMAFVEAHDNMKLKDDIAKSIYHSMLRLNPPGRFLVKNVDGSYSVKDKKSALTKIKTALNENSPKIIDYLKKRDKWNESGKVTTKQNKARPIPIPSPKPITTSPPTAEDWDKMANILKDIK